MHVDQKLSETQFEPAPIVATNAALSLQEIVGTPKYGKLLQGLRETLKTELHSHLGGAVPIEFIKKYSTPQAYAEVVGFIDKLKQGIDYSEGFKVFPMIRNVLTTNERLEEAVYEYCRSQFNDNVTFTELRTGLKKLDGGFEDCLKAVLAGIERGMRDYPITVTLLLSLRRDTPVDEAMETVELAIKYRGTIVTGIDVSGESIKGDGSGIFDALRYAKKNELPITLHLGENIKESHEQQIMELRAIQPDRVGHAVLLGHEAEEWIREKRVPVEACIRSALSVKMIEKPGDHPALKLFKEGHPVVFCTDDSTLFGDLSEELALAACLCDLSVEQVAEMQKRARNLAFNRDWV